MEWIKCSERMPKEGEKVIWFNGKIVWSGQIDENIPTYDENSWFCCYGPYPKDYKYWMPLPPEPKS